MFGLNGNTVGKLSQILLGINLLKIWRMYIHATSKINLLLTPYIQNFFWCTGVKFAIFLSNLECISQFYNTRSSDPWFIFIIDLFIHPTVIQVTNIWMLFTKTKIMILKIKAKKSCKIPYRCYFAIFLICMLLLI